MAVTPPQPRLTARRRATRDRVLEAASQVFAERGFHGASVEDICERAGFTRGAFYSNFASKDDLVLELSSRHAEAVVDRIRHAAHRDADASSDDMIGAVLTALVAEPGSSRDQWLVLTTEFTLHAIRDPQARAAWAAQQARIRDEVVAVVDEALDRRGLTLPMSTDVFVRAVMALSTGTLTQRLVEPGAVAVGELERTVVPVLLGLRT